MSNSPREKPLATYRGVAILPGFTGTQVRLSIGQSVRKPFIEIVSQRVV